MTWLYVIGGVFLFFAVCGIINKIRIRRAIKAEFLYQLALAKKNGTNEIHWDPKNVRYLLIMIYIIRTGRYTINSPAFAMLLLNFRKRFKV